MKPTFKKTILIVMSILLFLPISGKEKRDRTNVALISRMHSISSHALLDMVQELCSEKYDGRLTGTPGFNAAAQWASGLLEKMGIKAGGDNQTYRQEFPNPYTLVFQGSSVLLHLPVGKNQNILKSYIYEDDYIPGSTSDSGEVTAEVVYVGYGITAPELGFDEYAGMDVKGKIVLMEREVPVSPEKEPDLFKKWRPYSFHQYKVKNARAHGAAGMLYNYHITNPNCVFIKDFILTYCGSAMVNDIFAGTGYTHSRVKKKIEQLRVPQSFSTGKTMTLKNRTEHHPEGIGANIIGILEGHDPLLKNQAIIIGAHLDHVGRNHRLMPGANDNASGVSVVLGVAKALASFSPGFKRTVIFILFGAEEQGVRGSEYYLKNPVIPNDKVIAFINLDGVGRGTKIEALAALNYPDLWDYFKKANGRLVHREITPEYFQNLARPRLDAAHFMWARIPTISFSTYGAEPLPYSYYHRTLDTPDVITPEIMEDLARIIFIAVADMAGY
jgi:hypothetical protein